MRVVMGLSLTATSAVWALVDTRDGTILADELVPIDSQNEVARAAARSIQAFALQSEQDIDGVRMTWSEDARAHGVRMRTKMRLFGVDTVETVSLDAGREGSNRTARHIAPHLALAYGAARASVHDEHYNTMGSVGHVLHRLAARVPLRVAGAAGAALLIGVGLYAVMGGPSTPETPATAAAVTPATAHASPVAPAPRPVAHPMADAPIVDAPVDRLAAAPNAEPASAPAAVTPEETGADPLPSMNVAEDATPGPAEIVTGEPHLSGLSDVTPLAAPVPQPISPSATAPEPAPAARSDGPLSFVLGALP